MKLSEMIRENEASKVTEVLQNVGYKDFYNEHAPFSRFYTKDIEDNKTLYVRRDIEDYRGHNIWSFETWTRDNNKNILDKTVDSQHKKFNYINSIEALIRQIQEV
jgi:glutamate mutase epsilon subunit